MFFIVIKDCDHGTLKATADCWYCCTSNLCNDKCYGGEYTLIIIPKATEKGTVKPLKTGLT